MEELLNPDGVHTWLSALWPKQLYPNLIAGINDDDCAIIKVGNQEIIITTDYLNANPIAKQLGIATNRDLGRLLVGANLSDLLGTGAEPVAFLASIMMRKGTKLEDFKELIDGIKYQLDLYGIPLVGGDTKLGSNDVLCGTAIGICIKPNKLFIKNGAKKGDKIWLSGEVGNVGAAVNGLSTRKMSNDWIDWAKNILVSPDLPFDKSMQLSRSGFGKGGTDISDGLGENLYDLCESSNVGAIIYAEKIPVNDKVKELASILSIPPWFFSFSLGGDFQFIVTANLEHSYFLEKLGFFEIGEIKEANNILMCEEGSFFQLPRIGHTDFNLDTFSLEVQYMLMELKRAFGK
ncbi:thiamine-phosphate kinase [Spirosoma migulaei]